MVLQECSGSKLKGLKPRPGEIVQPAASKNLGVRPHHLRCICTIEAGRRQRLFCVTEAGSIQFRLAEVRPLHVTRYKTAVFEEGLNQPGMLEAAARELRLTKSRPAKINKIKIVVGEVKFFALQAYPRTAAAIKPAAVVEDPAQKGLRNLPVST